MNEVLVLLSESADDFFRRECPTEKAGLEDSSLSGKFVRSGLMEEASLAEAAVVFRTAGRYGSAVPAIDDWLISQPEADRQRLGAALCSARIAGVLERVLQMCIEYATDRHQFGVPLRRFQAVGQQLAILAAESAAAGAVADAACSDPKEWKVAAAKVRSGEAAGKGSDIAHQLHGAIGFTDEHPLRLFTRILWVSRDAYGSEAEWATVLGRYALNGDPWVLLTET